MRVGELRQEVAARNLLEQRRGQLRLVRHRPLLLLHLLDLLDALGGVGVLLFDVGVLRARSRGSIFSVTVNAAPIATITTQEQHRADRVGPPLRLRSR